MSSITAMWSALPLVGKGITLGIAGALAVSIVGVSIWGGVSSHNKKKNVAISETVVSDVSKKLINIYDHEFKSAQWVKEDSFNMYIKACAEVDKILKNISRIRDEYTKSKAKEEELGALSTDLYSQWSCIGDMTFENDLYKKWKQIDIQYQEVQKTTKMLFFELERLQKEYKDLEQRRSELYLDYKNRLEAFEKIQLVETIHSN